MLSIKNTSKHKLQFKVIKIDSNTVNLQNLVFSPRDAVLDENETLSIEISFAATEVRNYFYEAFLAFELGDHKLQKKLAITGAGKRPPLLQLNSVDMPTRQPSEINENMELFNKEVISKVKQSHPNLSVNEIYQQIHLFVDNWQNQLDQDQLGLIMKYDDKQRREIQVQLCVHFINHVIQGEIYVDDDMSPLAQSAQNYVRSNTHGSGDAVSKPSKNAFN